jgi:hypothetical protein
MNKPFRFNFSNGPIVEVTKLAVVGAKSGKYFEYPALQKSVNNSVEQLFCDMEFGSKVLTKIQACVGVGIYSLMLSFSDGTASPCIGSRQDFN